MGFNSAFKGLRRCKIYHCL